VGFCQGYVQASYEAMQLPDPPLCRTVALTSTEEIAAVVQYLRLEPAALNSDARAVVFAALQQSLSCL
jgi:hypothetical protein